MPSVKRRLDADELFSHVSGDLIRLCDDLLVLHEHNWPAFCAAIGDANTRLSKHETGFVLGFLAACIEPVEVGS